MQTAEKMEFWPKVSLISNPDKPAWRVKTLTNENAGEGLIFPYSCLFTIPDYWPYGYFSSEKHCELPGKLFRAKAGGINAPVRAFMSPAHWKQTIRYRLDGGRLYVAWKVHVPHITVEGGRYSHVLPSTNNWEVWSNRNNDGQIVWTIKTIHNGQSTEHTVKHNSDEPDFCTVQIILAASELEMQLDGKTTGRFEYDICSEDFFLTFGSTQTRSGGDEVVSEFREIFVNVFPYPYDGIVPVEGPEDIRKEDDAIVGLLCEATPQSPRFTEGDMIVLDDGSLLAAYTHYFSGESHDYSPSRIEARTSTNDGRTWSQPWIAVQSDAGSDCNVMSISLIRGLDGSVIMVYYDKTPEMSVKGMVLRRSYDGAKTWSHRIHVTPPNSQNTHVANNACLTRLKSGRLVLACREYMELRRPYACFSDDDGTTWQCGKHVPQPDLTEYQKQTGNINEPMICELPDGRLLMTMRTIAGGQYFSYSSDEGQTWSLPFLSPLRGTCSPACVSRIPNSNDIVAIWNYDYGTRTRLVSAVSNDGGQSWRNIKQLEKSLYHGTCYVSCTFKGNRVFLTYMHYPTFSSLFRFQGNPVYIDLRFISLPLEWFYRTPRSGKACWLT